MAEAPRPRRLTEAQMLLKLHLEELGYVVQMEYPFSSTRKFRFDVAVPGKAWGFECNGHFGGKHGAGWSNDAEKMNLAQALGWKCFVFHNRDVLTGNAKAWIQEHLP